MLPILFAATIPGESLADRLTGISLDESGRCSQGDGGEQE